MRVQRFRGLFGPKDSAKGRAATARELDAALSKARDVGHEVEIGVENGAIVLRKLEATCVFCGSTEDVAEYLGRGICAVCRGKVAA